MPDQEHHTGKTRIGERLRYIRHNHPDGLIEQARLAAKSGVSERHIRDVEAGKANTTVAKLEKIVNALGIDRVAYLLDEEVFEQVNAQLRSLQEARTLGVDGVRLRSHGTSSPGPSPSQEDVVAMLLARMAEIGDEAKRVQQDLPPSTAVDG
jgi:transcriptional regulator with XRE-family HTH domain